jgi:hypothetical protein
MVIEPPYTLNGTYVDPSLPPRWRQMKCAVITLFEEEVETDSFLVFLDMLVVKIPVRILSMYIAII